MDLHPDCSDTTWNLHSRKREMDWDDLGERGGDFKRFQLKNQLARFWVWPTIY